MMLKREIYISVDVEAAGPTPGDYSLLSIGACNALVPDQRFALQLKPINDRFVPAALEVSGLSLESLAQTGADPANAMSGFASWISDVCGLNGAPVFVGFNAPFDWAFINVYFHRYHGGNPFGHAALDIKALYMGLAGCTWAETRSSSMAKELGATLIPTHDALADALFQAELFRLILNRQNGAG